MADKYLNYTGLQEVVSKMKQYTDDSTKPGRNLIINTLYPSVDTYNGCPRIIGQPAYTAVRSIRSVAEHGFRTTNSSGTVNYPYIKFGESTGSDISLNGLTAGETYTFSADLTWKVLSNYTASTVRKMQIVVNVKTSGSSSFSALTTTVVSEIDPGVEQSGRGVSTFTLPSDAVAMYIIIRDSHAGALSLEGDFIELANIKLEKGSKATAWCAAPEDYGNARIFSGYCETEAATADKEVVCPYFAPSSLVSGAAILVRFVSSNSAAVADLTMNVNGTGAKPIKQLINSTATTLSAAGQLRFNQTYLFHYDGANWVSIFNYNNTYSSMTQTEANTGTATSARSISAKVLYDTITGRLADYMESDNLDISSGNDAIQIYYNGNNYSTYEAQEIDTLLGEKADKASFYQASSSSAKSCSAGTLTQINLSSTDAVSEGSGFSISANGIMATAAGKYRVTAAYSCSGMAASISKVSFTIRKGISFPDSTMVHQLTLSTPGNSSTWTSVFNVSSKIVSAKAGDIFFLGANFTGGAGTVAAGTDTFLLVERIS